METLLDFLLLATHLVLFNFSLTMRVVVEGVHHLFSD